MNSEFKKYIEAQINQTLNLNEDYTWQSVGGGSINETYKLTSKSHSLFVKMNTTSVFENGFKEEVLGLNFLKSHNTLTPKIISEGIVENNAFLVLEWIESGKETKQFWKNFASQLAELHQQKSKQFGLNHSNFMGQLHQKNDFYNDFSEFYIENRLKPQVKLAFNANKLEEKHVKQFEGLYNRIPEIFPTEKPSAVHGDLWNGNFICTSNENAIFIDPAVSFSHREVDIAMTQLFGGFSEEFYKTYHKIYPLEPCFNLRNNFYHLYPLLVHLNLFGSSYLESIENIIAEF